MAITYSSPNQKLVTIKHCDFPSKDNNYGILTRKVANIGINTLKKHPTAFLLFTDLCLNQDGYYFALSPTAINNRLGLSYEQYKRAVNTLIKYNYLVKDDTAKNHYIFYTIPQPKSESTVIDYEDTTSEIITTDQNNSQTSGTCSVENTSIIEPIITDDKCENTSMIEQTHTDDKGENIHTNITYSTSSNTFNSKLYSTEEIIEFMKSKEEKDTETLIRELESSGCTVKYSSTGYIVKEECSDRWLPINDYRYMLDDSPDPTDEELQEIETDEIADTSSVILTPLLDKFEEIEDDEDLPF